MFSKFRFRRNKPKNQNFLGKEGQKETPFIPPVQAKLNVGKPGDVYEKEADKTADEVVNKTEGQNNIQQKGAEEEEVQAKPLATGLTPFVQKAENAEEEEAVQAKAEHEEEEAVQAMEEEEAVQAKSSKNRAPSNQFEQELNTEKGAGNKMDAATQDEMQNAFGANFSNVRIHTDGKANQLNKQINAKAFTHGSDIYFKEGNYNPNNKEGKHLLAHELTHTVQQGAVNALTKTSKGSAPVQREEISYRALTWADFSGPVDADSEYDAATYSGGKLDGTGFINGAYSAPGDEVTLTVTYDATKIKYSGFMETDESWKKGWLTDDAAARTKLGEDADIEAARSSLLGHEQTHFRISKAIADKYEPLIQAAVPAQAATKVVSAATADAALAALQTFMAEKNTEVMALLQVVIDQASAERQEVQDLYDDDTNHSQETAQQQNWQDNFDDALRDAIERVNAPPEEENANQGNSE